jgi:hypothetical protein
MKPANPKKPDVKTPSLWITQGRGELHTQTPAQRGLQVESPTTAPAKVTKAKRERFTVNLSPALIEWTRRAVVFTAGETLAGLLEGALTTELKRLEAERGEPFPATTATPKRGRPVVLRGVR